MARNKDLAIKDFLYNTKDFFTWKKLSKEERETFSNFLRSQRAINHIKGNYQARYDIIQDLYFMFLLGLGYTHSGWRE